MLAVALTAVLVWFGTGLDPCWPLVWFAPLPVLLLAARTRWWIAALAAAAAWSLGLLNLWHYVTAALHIPGAVVAQIYGTEAAAFVLAVLLYRALLRRGAYWAAVVAFPATRVAFEYLTSAISPHGTAGSLAYSQLSFLPFLQLASITGPWGMTFLLLLFPAALAAAWQLRRTRRRALRVLAAALGAIIAVLVSGAVRLALDTAGPTVKVGLVASDPPTSPQVADEGPATAALFDAYAARASALAAQGARIIVLPEKLGVVVEPGTRDSDARFQALADTTGAIIVVGLIRVAPPVKYNEARIYAPGSPVQRYTKHHLLPSFESKFVAGDALALVSLPAATLGVTICKDMDFTPLSRAYGHAGAALLLVPAYDFGLDRLLHGHMAVMRGVESGFGLVRAAKNGYLTVSDNRGRILAEATSDAAPFATLLADAPVAHAATLYLRFGDWFAWLALALLAATVVQLVRSRRVARS